MDWKRFETDWKRLKRDWKQRKRDWKRGEMDWKRLQKRHQPRGKRRRKKRRHPEWEEEEDERPWPRRTKRISADELVGKRMPMGVVEKQSTEKSAMEESREGRKESKVRMWRRSSTAWRRRW